MSALLDGVDWETVAVLAALVLLEGLRRIPAGGLVVRAVGLSGWKPAGQPEPRTRWALVSWWSPVARALVLTPLDGAAAVSSEQLAARVRLARRAAPWLGSAGAITLVALVLGLPVATARAGAVGFVAGAAIVLMLAAVTATGGRWVLRRIGASPGSGRRQVLGWYSPFASGRVLEGIYQAAVAGASPAQALRVLADEVVFAEWARARAYDVVRAGREDLDLSVAAGVDVLKSIVASRPLMADGGGSYCPRCAVVWVAVRESCPDCDVPAMSVSGRTKGRKDEETEGE